MAGASLVQLYTAMVYQVSSLSNYHNRAPTLSSYNSYNHDLQGPPVAGKVRRELSSLLADSSFSTLQQAVGANHRQNDCEADQTNA